MCLRALLRDDGHDAGSSTRRAQWCQTRRSIGVFGNRMLAAATGCEVIATGGATGTSQGAALLCPGVTPPEPAAGALLPDLPASARGYIAAWRAAVRD